MSARGCGWFLDRPEATETLGYALVAAGFDEQEDSPVAYAACYRDDSVTFIDTDRKSVV